MTIIKPFPQYPKSDPRFYLSPNKKAGSPMVVFVHFFGGHQRVLKRHIELVNDLGYDAFAFNMPEFAGLKLSLLYKGRFGIKHVYNKMLTYFLNQIEGQKIIFSFSNPSASAIEAIYDRTKIGVNDIVGLICDSGPSAAFMRSAWNLAVRSPNRYLLLGLFAFFWSIRLHNDLRYQLRRFPKNFPLLSIRGGQDEIVPPWHIEKAFAHLERFVQVDPVTIEKAGHLDALKNYPVEYRKALETWLQNV